MGRGGIGLAVMMVVAGVAPAHAQEAPEPRQGLASPARMPGILVEETRVPANTTVITAEEIKRSGALTIQDLLARLEGVNVLDARGFGLESDTTVNLRGIINSSRSNVLVLIDGVRQNRLTGDEVHWPSIPLQSIERIEVIRGGGGMIYGEGALAGVINILTKQGGEELLQTEAGVEVGSYGWQKYHVASRGRSDPLTYGVGVTRNLFQGYREFSMTRNSTVNAHSGLQLAEAAHLNVNVLHSEDTTAFPGSLTLAQTEARREQAVLSRAGYFDDETDQVSADLVLEPWEGTSAALTLFWRDRLTDSVRSGLYTHAPSRGASFRTTTRLDQGEMSNLLVSGLELTDDKATVGTRGSTPEDESNRKGYGVYVEDTLTLWERLSLVGGFRFDKFRYEESLSFPSFLGTLRFEGFSPKAGVTYAVVPKTLDLFAAYSRPFKAPNVDDFAAQVPQFSSNVDLQPQQADTYEAGVTFAKAPLTAKATGFYTRIDDEILFNQLDFQNQNFDTQRFGAEFSAKMDLPEQGVRGYATYTFVDAEFRQGPFTEQTIPGTPEHTFNAGVGYSPFQSFWVNLDWQLVHDFFRINDFNNILPGDNYGVLNLTFQYERPFPRANTRWFLTIRNLTNEEYVSFQTSNATNAVTGAGENPMPPIHVVCGMTIEF